MTSGLFCHWQVLRLPARNMSPRRQCCGVDKTLESVPDLSKGFYVVASEKGYDLSKFSTVARRFGRASPAQSVENVPQTGTGVRLCMRKPTAGRRQSGCVDPSRRSRRASTRFLPVGRCKPDHREVRLQTLHASRAHTYMRGFLVSTARQASTGEAWCVLYSTMLSADVSEPPPFSITTAGAKTPVHCSQMHSLVKWPSISSTLACVGVYSAE